MNVSEAVASRRSVRAFLDRPIDPALIRQIVAAAARAPSGGNLQPWHIAVIGGEPLAQLKTLMQRRVLEAPRGETPEYEVYPKDLPSPYRDYRFRVGEALYGELGIPREDKLARLRWFANNFRFFGAPLALFCSIDRAMGPPQWSDLGMYLQTLMLLLREAGLDSCAQECWSLYPATLGKFLELPPQRMLFCGMSIGYADPAAPANRLHAERAPLESFAEFRGL